MKRVIGAVSAIAMVVVTTVSSAQAGVTVETVKQTTEFIDFGDGGVEITYFDAPGVVAPEPLQTGQTMTVEAANNRNDLRRTGGVVHSVHHGQRAVQGHV